MPLFTNIFVQQLFFLTVTLYWQLPMKLSLTAFICLFATIVCAQTKTINFAAVDKNAKQVSAATAADLSQKLTAPYKTELEKVRAIFIWITDNIAYDVYAYHNTEAAYAGLFRPYISTVDSIVKKDYNDRVVQKVLNERKAICDGYSRLFKTLCDYANIQSVIVDGNIRWYTDRIGLATSRPHAWNAVLIDKKWYLLDATWASGTATDNEVSGFVKRYNEFYFLPEPNKLITDHYPDDTKWALLTNIPTKQQFYGLPHFHTDFYTCNIKTYSPTDGTIQLTCVRKNIHIELETEDVKESLVIGEYPDLPSTIKSAASVDSLITANEHAKLYAPKHTIIGNKIILDYELQSVNTKRIDVYYNNKAVISYSIWMFK